MRPGQRARCAPLCPAAPHRCRQAAARLLPPRARLVDALHALLRHERGQRLHHLSGAEGQAAGNLKLVLRAASQGYQQLLGRAGQRLHASVLVGAEARCPGLGPRPFGRAMQERSVNAQG